MRERAGRAAEPKSERASHCARPSSQAPLPLALSVAGGEAELVSHPLDQRRDLNFALQISRLPFGFFCWRGPTSRGCEHAAGNESRYRIEYFLVVIGIADPRRHDVQSMRIRERIQIGADHQRRPIGQQHAVVPPARKVHRGSGLPGQPAG